MSDRTFFELYKSSQMRYNVKWIFSILRCMFEMRLMKFGKIYI